ncbi:LLM class flavin-dependent oxidoreductase [Aeromicrobium sp. YIM 150415]|uniref:LLM class flavin-dependent oxidoreductase n=1 Tax=Aeromicrobium sp. YIM 150415 TaxID=2803912 RepID=UPI001966BF51|nr:LLM class flavin-dependent oxidoreductase [Aeromicrobium sp. YIM 150415]MBM9464389.1 LLM class flavin-dependent oxidoreductase [Aeromicrobium sp. YIM 150415]
MPDYGHQLRFGSFINPVNRPAQQPVELAVLSEELGLDLVTFQDHPYQAVFHDTWTLLTWVAARTSHIHVSGNVLNLPLRQPAVLARALASLDLLSGGRAELGIGTGGFFEAMASMGAPLLTPPDAVSGLDEALDIIRGMWDVGATAPLRIEGRFHRVDGAQRGPAPAHRIPIWVGAYKPRMQRIIGRKGDGWLPSLPWMKPGDLTKGNRVIDESARREGRDPGEIVRLLNIVPPVSAEQMTRLAIEDGVSTFILGSDDPDELRRFAQVTAPEIRDRVESARADSGQSSTTPRPTPSLGGDPVPASLAGLALAPGARDYPAYTSGFFRGARPALVLRPQTPAEVQDAVRYALRHRDVPLGIRSGGHGLSGRSVNDGGIVIAVDGLDEITVLDGGRARLGPGARWGDVAATLAPHGLALTAGDHGSVGVGGLATAGGIGWFVREHGLTIDHLRSVEVVTADGELVRASATEHADLFWAMRGSGANFGVAVSFEFDLHPVGSRVGFAILVYTPDDIADFLQSWGTTLEAAHSSVTGTLMINPSPRGGPVAAQALIVVDSDDPDNVIDRLQPFAGLAPVADQSVQLMPYAALLAQTAESEVRMGRGEPRSHSGLVRHLDADVANGIADLLSARSSFILTVRSAGGAVAGTPADATAYAWREANFFIATLGGGSTDFEKHWNQLVPAFEGMYLSFETDTGPDIVARAFPPAHLRRLRELKRQWDPTGLFRDNFFIDPTLADPVADPSATDDTPH